MPSKASWGGSAKFALYDVPKYFRGKVIGFAEGFGSDGDKDSEEKRLEEAKKEEAKKEKDAKKAERAGCELFLTVSSRYRSMATSSMSPRAFVQGYVACTFLTLHARYGLTR
ncbi:hypothetical protein P152DRAFT_515570 [Eremomyces bilateralis CBS 781.70]|uniref:Uncharacterized protein n=1 Tax=Eremomyces bilateralis CBS 781.70 TaxID=1392243 RepID=A0A6G1FY10_9PEZI|nr:uncharacterized protein P152DRAFT_515570 [Eremomyces bilateralis CBS 781.70]KAF1810765.1 hypothetical protein P152DRAFT_515570 [Eremomyces bilateralis CBS 781.70]